MPSYHSGQAVKSGVPLGGIGAGKLEIFPDGALRQFTGLNNWSQPRGLEGFAFAVRVNSGGRSTARVLQTAALGELPRVRSIRFEGRFPRAMLRYEDPDLPVECRLDAYSPLIPFNEKDSAFPGAVLLFRVKNPDIRPVEVSLLAMGANVNGQYEVGRYNEVSDNGALKSLRFRLRNPLPSDATAGEVSLSIPKALGEISWLGEWNLQKECWKFGPEDYHFPYFDEWTRTGRLPDRNTKEEIASNNRRWGGALSVTLQLEPGQERTFPVIITWHAPKSRDGHRYESWLRDSNHAARALHARWPELKDRTEDWQKILLDAKLQPWLKDALINNLYVLFSGTWWTRNGSFSIYEAPIVCPLMGTLDVRYYGSIPLALLFPELEKKEMLQYVAAQRENGYIPHDLGRERLDMPSDGTTYYYWKDLNPKFILLVYRDFLWTRDKAFLKKCFPAARKAMQFIWSTDKNRDGLPDNEGMDQTYDVWPLHGTNSYISGIYLASLRAAAKMADILNDPAWAKRCEAEFARAAKSFERQLWNGHYFITERDGKKTIGTSMAGQQNGQWIANLLNLGPLAEPAKIRSAVEWTLKLNAGDSRFGATNSVFPNGKRDRSNTHSQSVWPGESYALAALAIDEGRVKEGLALAEKTWANFAERQKNPWNQPDVIRADGGEYGFGDYYMRNMVVWTVLLSLARRDPEAARALDRLRALEVNEWNEMPRR